MEVNPMRIISEEEMIAVVKAHEEKAKKDLEWKPETPLSVWVGWMVRNDIKLLKK